MRDSIKDRAHTSKDIVIVHKLIGEGKGYGEKIDLMKSGFSDNEELVVQIIKIALINVSKIVFDKWFGIDKKIW